MQFSAPDLSRIAEGLDEDERQQLDESERATGSTNMNDTGAYFILSSTQAVTNETYRRLFLRPSTPESPRHLRSNVRERPTYTPIPHAYCFYGTVLYHGVRQLCNRTMIIPSMPVSHSYMRHA